MCGIEETWEHTWEKCENWVAKRSWKKMVESSGEEWGRERLVKKIGDV